MYPNGQADVNQFQAAGGPGFVLRELLDAGLMHADVPAVGERGLRAHAEVPALQGEQAALERAAAGQRRHADRAHGGDAVLAPAAA